MGGTGPADIYNLHFFLPEEFMRTMYAAADVILANGKKPFNFGALEVMAAKGIAFTGNTGVDYAISLENAVIIEADDPDEIVDNLLYLHSHPEEQMRIRSAGYNTAQQLQWDRVINNLISELKL